MTRATITSDNVLMAGDTDELQQVACRVTAFGMNVRGTLRHWRDKAQKLRRWFSLEAAAGKLAEFVRRFETEPERLEPNNCSDRGNLSSSDLRTPGS